MMRKPKILIFNGYYYPSKNCGGPVTSIENIVNTCYDDYDIYIVCYNHDWDDNTPFNVDTNKWTQFGKAKVMYVENNYLDFSMKHMGALFDNLRPDLVWFSGILTPNNKIVAALNGKKKHIPVLFSPRGEVSADRICIKGYKKIPYLKIINFLGIFKGCYFHGTSDDEIEGLNKYFNPKPDHIFKIANIAITQQENIVPLKKEKGVLKAMFFSRIHEVKNLLYAFKVICNCKERVIFDIYGPIESQDYWNQCLKVYESAPANIEINYKGILSKHELNKTIQEHDCFLFPTTNENYGHVIAESLANSRPVILSKGTTPWDDLDTKAGYVISLDNPEEFTSILDYYAILSNEEFKKIVGQTKQYFCHKVSANSAVEGHKKMFKEIIMQNR